MPAAEVKAGCDVKFVWKGSEDETGEEGRGEGSMRFGKAGKSVSIKGVFRGMYGEKLAFEGRKVDDEPTGGRTMALYVIKRAA